jgi:ABC-2 type transport system permease protein
MNAMIDTPPRAPVAAPHATHQFRLLLRREFWEHKGGFFWAPIVAGGISLLLTAMAIIVGEVAARRAMDAGEFRLGDADVVINGLDLGAITSRMDAGDMANLAGAMDLSALMASSWPFIVLGFVVFFYCLGSLYDERKDRSVLFWKSLPVSDRDTVLSKVASAVLVAPLLAVGAALVTMFGFLLVISLVVLAHGGNPWTLVWGPGSPLKVAAQLVATVPVYALWALPTVGWLMLCSAWARSKPFLWALMVPLFAGIFVSWFDLMQVFDLETAWFWKNVVARALLSVAPGTWIDAANLQGGNFNGPESIGALLSLKTTYSVLLTPQLWIGAIAGAAMIFGAIRLRRWRDDN